MVIEFPQELPGADVVIALVDGFGDVDADFEVLELCLNPLRDFAHLVAFESVVEAETVDAGGINIYFPGEIRAVDTEIEKEKFFKLMADKRFIDQKNEKKARKFLPN